MEFIVRPLARLFWGSVGQLVGQSIADRRSKKFEARMNESLQRCIDGACGHTADVHNELWGDGGLSAIMEDESLPEEVRQQATERAAELLGLIEK